MKSKDLDILEEKTNKLIEIAQQLRLQNKELREKNSQILVEFSRLQSENKQISKEISENKLKQSTPIVPQAQIEELKKKIHNILSKLDSD